jgi:hypothetical protein
MNQNKEKTMTRKILEISISFFFIVCGICVLLGTFWLKPVIDSQRLLNENSLITQQEILKTTEEAKTLITEVGFSAAVIAMQEADMIKPADANAMIEESIKNIEAKSERFGKLVKLLNESRINEEWYLY